MVTWAEQVHLELVPLSAGLSFALRDGCIRHYLFKIRHDGELVISYQYLVNHAPFSDHDVREQIRVRLCGIPGVHIDPSRLKGKPRVPLTTLATPASLVKFQDAWLWGIELVRKGGGGSRAPNASP